MYKLLWRCVLLNSRAFEFALCMFVESCQTRGEGHWGLKRGWLNSTDVCPVSEVYSRLLYRDINL